MNTLLLFLFDTCFLLGLSRSIQNREVCLLLSCVYGCQFNVSLGFRFIGSYGLDKAIILVVDVFVSVIVIDLRRFFFDCNWC